MTGITSFVQAAGSMRRRDSLKALPNEMLQQALQKAGYRVNDDGYYGPRTEQVVRNFQSQHHLPVTGVVDLNTAAQIDQPHALLVGTAKPLTVDVQGTVWPHDDTASLVDFYGDPREGLAEWKARSVVTVPCPWPLTYEGTPWPHEIQFHRKAAPGLAAAFETIRNLADSIDSPPLLKHVSCFSGSGEFRPIRGSSRLSTHAFWAAIDFDAGRLPLGHDVSATEMPEEIVKAFLDAGAFWGGNYTGRKDPMHFQWAHE